MTDVSFHLFNDDVCFMTFKVVLESLVKHDSVTIRNTYMLTTLATFVSHVML
jgi:hypothetical protein